MRILKGMIAAGMAWAVFGPVAAEAQTTPRIIMRRPLAPADATVTPPAGCGQAGQPACPTSNCDYVGAAWDVGKWSGAACGEDGTVSRTVRCVGIARDGQRVPQPDQFCLQDAAAFAASCGNGSVG